MIKSFFKTVEIQLNQLAMFTEHCSDSETQNISGADSARLCIDITESVSFGSAQFTGITISRQTYRSYEKKRNPNKKILTICLNNVCFRVNK